MREAFQKGGYLMRKRIIFLSVTAVVMVGAGFVGKCLFDSLRELSFEFRAKNQVIADQAYNQAKGEIMNALVSSIQKEGRVVVNLMGQDGKPQTITLVPASAPKTPKPIDTTPPKK